MTAKIILLAFLISLANLSKAHTDSMETIDLHQSYELAKKQSENLQIHAEKIVQVDEKYKQAFSAIAPRLSLNFSEFFQDTSGVEGQSGGVGGTFTQSERPELKFAVRQPVFSGFREYAALSSFKSEKKKENHLLNRALKLLFLEVARSFYQVIQLENDLENVRVIINLTQERVKELQSRVKLGKSRPSELLSVESQLASLQSQEEKIKGEITLSQEAFSYLIGKDAGKLKLADTLQPAENLESGEKILSYAEMRSDVQAAQEELLSRKYKAKIARGSLLPTANLTGSYYLKRKGFQEAIDWDITFNLDVPLFQGGGALAQYRESISQIREAEKTLMRLTREVVSEIKRSFLILKSTVNQSRILKTSFEKAQESYKLQVEEYRFGLVNNLEVLQALNNLQENKRNFDRTVIQSKLNLLQLKVATEEMP